MALVAAVILAAAGIGLGLYRDHNLHHDERMTKRTLSAGYVERHATVGGVTVNYAEGPSDGLALLLIHGQGMAGDFWALYLRGGLRGYLFWRLRAPTV